MVPSRVSAACALVAVAHGLSCLPISAQTSHPPSILLNDRSVAGLHPFIERDRVLVAVVPDGAALGSQTPEKPSTPAQALFWSMRAVFVYDNTTRTATVMSGRLYPSIESRSVSSTVGSGRLVETVQRAERPDGPLSTTTSARPLRVSPRVAGGIVYVPLRAFAEAAGAYVAWDAAKRVVVLRTLPPSAQELAAEAAARARLDAIGRKSRDLLDDAARNLS